MRSDRIKQGFERAPHRALLKATGVTDADMRKPFIAVCNSYIDIIPGHRHLQEFAALVKDAIREAVLAGHQRKPLRCRPYTGMAPELRMAHLTILPATAASTHRAMSASTGS